MMQSRTEQASGRKDRRRRDPYSQESGRRERVRVQRKAGPRGEVVAAVVIIVMALASAGVVFSAMLHAGRAPEAPVDLIKTVPRAATEPEGTAGFGTGEQLSNPLLVLVNDRTPLPEDWQVTPAMIGDETVDQRAYADLDAMFQAAQQQNIWLWVASGYRSVEDQEGVLQQEIRAHMEDGMTEDEARELSLRTIARPGYSEHHTGLAVDINDVSDHFEDTAEYKWLQQHAAEYGFVQRYRSDKVEITGIDNESWHYRYVGRENAQEMERLDMCLEEYVEYLKTTGVS